MMASSGAGRRLVTLCIAAAPCFAQGRVSEFLGVKNWHGTIQVAGTGSGSSNGGIYSDVWQFGTTSKFDITLDTLNANSQSWTGTFQGTSNLNGSDKATFSNCTETLMETFMGTVGTGKTFTMHLQGDNQYMFFPSDYTVQGGSSSADISCGGKTTGTGVVSWLPGLGDKIQTLPATGFSLKGSMDINMNSPVQPLSLVFGGTAAQIKVTMTWDIEPGAVSPNEVVVQKTAALMNWRPTAGANGTRGNSVDLIAKLQQQGGAPTTIKAAYFIWQFSKCSKEPGYAMNAELDSPNPGFDLKLESGADGLIVFDDTGQKAQSKPGEYTQSTATVASYDWGGFGTIKVTAYLPDGSTLDGYLEGDQAQADIRLPLRPASSLIADAWKKQHPEVDGLADISDNESSPVGDGSPGDGLTLYEEYRGFIINGQHVEGNPTKKDYFIVNNAGWLYQSGLKLFQYLSGLEVHYNLRKTELPQNRVINKNHNEGAHIVDQHGVVITAIAANAGYAEAFGGPGTPGMISQIVAPRILPGSSYNLIDYLGSSLAHELFHACNVYHHGKGSSLIAVLQRLPTDVVLVDGVPRSVITEPDGASAAPLLPVNQPVSVILGRADDVHTGNDDCVMRYDDASGYIPNADPTSVCYTPGETAGTSLCTSRTGTGINDSGRSPQARYGDASFGLGNCVGQILVNDKITAPRR